MRNKLNTRKYTVKLMLRKLLQCLILSFSTLSKFFRTSIKSDRASLREFWAEHVIKSTNVKIMIENKYQK